jgi:hypothetical protein
MTLLPSGVKVHLALGITDMRKGLDGLAMLVQGVLQAIDSPIAAEALRRIGELYAVEDRIRGRSAELRRMVRGDLARPLVDSLKLSRTAGSSSTPTRWSGPSGPSLWAARTICSPVPMAAPTAGPSSAR